MSLSKRVSLPPQPPPQPQDLKHRVITCLNKLSDRDTFTIATSELESIAINLNHDLFSPFLTYLSATSSTDKSPVRKQCVRILGLLSLTHGNALSPHVFKMINAVIRRLRDSDSAVRLACVASVTSIASEISSPSFSSLAKPLVDAVLTEQDQNSQIGAALCLSAAIDASPDPEPVELRKLLPRVLKLIKSDSFKAKPALLGVIGSICAAGGAGFNLNLLNSLIPCLIEFLCNEDWAARKAAVEALGRLAVAEKVQLTDYRLSCLSSLENKRFDKVKVVRESINQTLELWKQIPEHVNEVPVSPQLNGNSSSKVSTIVFETPPKETIKRSYPTTQSRSPPKSNYKKQSGSIVRKVDFDQENDSKVNVHVPKPVSVDIDCKEKFISEQNVPDNDKIVIVEMEKRVVSSKSRFGSRVVPFIDNSELDIDTTDNATEDAYGNQKEAEDLSRIQKQLVQIENQQSNLLNLLKKFIGSSRNGMNSLETRVNGLEKALDEISYDLAISTGRVSTNDSCCMGTEFVSPKYWWRAEGSFPGPRSPFRGTHQSISDRFLPNKDFNPDITNMGSPSGGIAPNTQARMKKTAQGQNRNFDRFDGGNLVNCLQQRI